jgi:hypothetical protein
VPALDLCVRIRGLGMYMKFLKQDRRAAAEMRNDIENALQKQRMADAKTKAKLFHQLETTSLSTINVTQVNDKAKEILNESIENKVILCVPNRCALTSNDLLDCSIPFKQTKQGPDVSQVIDEGIH